MSPTSKELDYAYIPVPKDFLKEVDISVAIKGYRCRKKYLEDLAKKIKQDNKRLEHLDEPSRKFIDFTW